MITLRCKCGERVLFTSMGTPDCMGCEICGTTFAGSPENHKPLQPHAWEEIYNQSTGKPYKRCKNCYEVDEESFKEAKIK